MIEDAETSTPSHRLKFSAAMKRSLSAMQRSSHPGGPPIEMVSVNAEKMDIHDALNKYKV